MQNNIAPKLRDTNIEFLRIVLMIMIILYHFVIHGAELKFKMMLNGEFINNKLYYVILSLTCVAVNCYVFISGYYGIKFKLRTFVGFFIQAIFYSVFFYLLSTVYNEEFQLTYFIKSLFPISFSNKWWFLNIYLIIYLLSPLINKGLNLLNKTQFMFLILLLIYFQGSYTFSGRELVSGDGLSVYSMLTMYIIGRFCRKYDLIIKRPIVYYCTISLFLAIIVYHLASVGFINLACRFITYNSVLVVLGSILFFYIFKNMKLRHSPFINEISTLVFGVYLIHETRFVSRILYPFVGELISNTNNNFVLFLSFIGLALLVFIICATIEKIRQVMFKPLEDCIFKINTLRKLSMLIDSK